MARRESAKNIQVCLRVRPPTAAEREGDHSFQRVILSEDKPNTVKLALATSSNEYAFTNVFPPTCTQKEVYTRYGASAVDAAMNGEHGVLLAYGQTGSGKTFTMASQPTADDAGGVIVQAFHDIWNRIANDGTNSYELALSVVELYMEEVFDLSKPDKPKVKFHEMANTFYPVRNEQDALHMFQASFERREVGSTGMNARSSRSHLVMSLSVLIKPKSSPRGSGGGNNKKDACFLDGRLLICDLAGSERLVKTQSTGSQRDEGIAINLSLLALSNAVSALSQGLTFVQFRESLLTRMLQNALRGKGDTSILVNVSPSDENIKETWHAVEFGQRAQGLQQRSERHEILNYKNLYQDAMADICGLQDQIRERDDLIGQLRAMLRRVVDGGAVEVTHSDDDDDEEEDRSSVASSSSLSNDVDVSLQQGQGVQPFAPLAATQAPSSPPQSSDPSPPLSRRTLGDDDGGEAMVYMSGRSRRTNNVGESPRALASLVEQLREDIEEREDCIVMLDAEVKKLEQLLHHEREQKQLEREKHLSALVEIANLEALLRELQTKSLQGSPMRNSTNGGNGGIASQRRNTDDVLSESSSSEADQSPEVRRALNPPAKATSCCVVM